MLQKVQLIIPRNFKIQFIISHLKYLCSKRLKEECKFQLPDDPKDFSMIFSNL